MKNNTIFLVIGLLSPWPVLADTFTVNTFSDGPDLDPGDTVCEVTDGVGDCTIRAAVMETNALAGSHLVKVPEGKFLMTIDGTDDEAALGDLDINGSELTISGAGAGLTLLDANGIDRFFQIANSSVEMSDLTIQGGVTDADSNSGGAILVNPAFELANRLALARVELLNNQAKLGGAIKANNNSVVEIVDSLIQGNETIDVGGGNRRGAALYCQGCEMTVTNSTIDGNGDDLSGKVVEVDSDGHLNILNSTISGSVGGGVRASNGNVSIRSTTLVNNGGQNLSFFSFDDSHIFDVANSVLQHDSSDNCQTGDLPESLGYNVVGDTSCSFAATGDIEDSDALLAALADNGGPTFTHLPAAGSPAVDRVPVDQCKNLDGAALEFDQRGTTRPLGAACDAGSVEVLPVAEPLILRDGFEDIPE